MVKITVIIPTLNRGSLLKKAIDSIINQTLTRSNYEIIVVDNGSTDSTKGIVLEYSKVVDNILYIYESTPGLHSGRHCGFLNAKGDILVYADDDIEAFPTLLETIKKGFDDREVAMVGGKNLPNFESNPPEWLQILWSPNEIGNRILGYLSILDLGNQPKSISPNYIFGCNFAIRRSILEEAGGFHPDGMPQELIRYRGDGESHVSQYVESKGYKALYHPKASVYHWVSHSRMTKEYFCLRAYNQGISDSYTQIRKNYQLGDEQKKINPKISFSKILNKGKSFYNRAKTKPLLRLAKKIFDKIQNQQNNIANPINSDLWEIQSQINEAYQKGFDFHQQETTNNPDLLEWVLRPNYWDYKLPMQKE